MTDALRSVPWAAFMRLKQGHVRPQRLNHSFPPVIDRLNDRS